MCGIFGSTNILESCYWKDSAQKALYHRGPDHTDTWHDKTSGILLGQCRLTIIDLNASGFQPMHSQSGRYVIVYNGEIYNFQEIKVQLKKEGYLFKGTSDTEVLLAAIDVWGLDSLSLFAGMFAFALWDKQEKTLYLVRDRIGIKPLYYAIFPHSLVFSSELKPILLHPEFQKEINREAVSLYLNYRYIPAPHTIYKNIYKLLPATILKLNLAEFPTITTQNYWSMRDTINNSLQNLFVDQKQAQETLEAELLKCVQEHTIADVSLGAFLSGGIDSATVVALMKKSMSKVKTFTIGFDEPGYNEAHIAKKIAHHLGTEHTEIYLRKEQILKQIPNLAQVYDEPFADASALPTLLVSQIARENVKVALSGDGGDELFAGYNRYTVAPQIWKRICKFPYSLRKNIGTGLEFIPDKFWNSIIFKKYTDLKLTEKIAKVAEVMRAETATIMYENLVRCWQQQEILLNKQKINIPLHPEYPNLVHHMMYKDSISYLPDDILTKVDRASMFHSLEVRVPFLDHRIVACAWRIPLEMKIGNNHIGKKILRNILHQYVPENIFNQTKMGFAFPVHKWLRTDLREWTESLLSEKRLIEDGFFDAKKIKLKWQEHLSGKRNWQDQLWTILMFQLWLDQ